MSVLFLQSLRSPPLFEDQHFIIPETNIIIIHNVV